MSDLRSNSFVFADAWILAFVSRERWWVGAGGTLLYGLIYLGWNYLWFGVNDVYVYPSLQVSDRGGCVSEKPKMPPSNCAGATK